MDDEYKMLISMIIGIPLIVALAISICAVSSDYFNTKNIKQCTEQHGSWVHYTDQTGSGFNCIIK